MILKMIKRAEEPQEEVQDNMPWLMGGVDIENRLIEIRGEVNEQFSSVLTRAVMGMCQISLQPIKIILSSFGGDAYEALYIYDFLTNCPAEIHIQGSGKIFSSGFVIYLAGDVRTATPNSTFMMHSASYAMPTEAPVKNHKVEVIETERINNIFLEIAGTKTNRNKKWWARNVLTQDRYFNTIDAVELGIIKEKPVVKKKTKKVRKNVKV